MSFGINIKSIFNPQTDETISNKTHGKDIMLLCKGWYNKEKYKTLKDALIEYYHKYYGNEDYTPDYDFINKVLLKQAVQELLTDRFNGLLVSCLFDTDVADIWKFDIKHMKLIDLSYEEELYYRLTKFLNKFKTNNRDGIIYIDTSVYWLKDENGNDVMMENARVLEESII